MAEQSDSMGRRRRQIQIEARERKICTVAFIDIVQSTALIEDLDPEDALDRLGPAVEMIMDTCEEFGASVRFVGDGALAVFGFPVADENHCIRAVEAGLTAIERVTAMETDKVNIRVGIDSGPVLFSNLSHSSFDELTLTGPVVNMADKIQGAAQINTVTVSQKVVDTVREMFLSQEVGNMQISGMDHPTPLFEILGRDHSVTRWKLRVGRGLSPFMGREVDLCTLQDAWAAAKMGSGSSIAVVGEAGIGKSRLLHEFTKTVDPSAAQVLEVNATALDKKAAYAPLARALRHHLALSETDSPTQFAEKISAYLDPGTAGFQRYVSALRLVLQSGNDDPQWTLLGPQMRQDTILEGLLKVITGIARDKPLAVIVEDMHWADQYTFALCLELVQTTPESQILVILTSRQMEGLEGDTGHAIQHLQLGSLDTGSSRELINKLLNHDGDRAKLSRFVDKISGQTPLFIEEIVRNLKIGRISADESLGVSFEVPESVQPLIAQRIDALPPGSREALQIASVIGSEFPIDLLKQLLRQEGLEDSRSLTFLAKLDLLDNVDAPIAKFRHALIQQVAYSMLPKRRLRYLHGLAFEILKAMKLASSLSSMSSLAYHAEQSQRWIEAAEALIACGHLALERAAFDDGITYFDKAIACAERLDAGTLESAKLNMQARQGLRVAYGPKAEFYHILRLTGEIEQLADMLGDDASALGAGIDQVILRTVLSDVTSAIPSGKAKLEAAIARGAPGYIATAVFALSQAYWFGGAFEKAIDISKKFEHLYVLDNDRLTNRTTGTVSVLGMGTYANALSRLGAFDKAAEVCSRTKTLAEATGKPYDIAFQAISAGIRALEMADFASSRDSLLFAQETSQTSNIIVLRAFLSAPLARAHAGLGDLGAARQAIEMGKAVACPAGMSAFVAHLLAAELDVFQKHGETELDESLQQRLLDLCQSNGYGGVLSDG